MSARSFGRSCAGAVSWSLALALTACSGGNRAVPAQELDGSSAAPYGITVGPDGALWFAESNVDAIGRITTAGTFSEFPGTGPYPFGIAAGADGCLWFMDEGGSDVERITTTGKITSFPLAVGAGSLPWFITAGPNRTMWFTVDRGFKVGKIQL